MKAIVGPRAIEVDVAPRSEASFQIFLLLPKRSADRVRKLLWPYNGLNVDLGERA